MANEKDAGPNKKPIDAASAEAAKYQAIYGVGYSKPPPNKQFKPGQSGNPKGRPRKPPVDLSLSDQPMLNAILNAANQRVKMRDGDQVREVGMPEALAQALNASALKGNARSLGVAMDQIRQAHEARARDIRERNEFWQDYKSRLSKAFAEAAKAGLPEPAILPHPEDVIIDRYKGPIFVGPMDEEERKLFDKTRRYRDVEIMQDVFDRRYPKRLDGTSLTEPGAALLFAINSDNTLPPRLRLSTSQMILIQMKYQALAKRELLKLLFRSWARIRKPKPRGYVSDNLSTVRRYLEATDEFLREFRAGNFDMEAMGRGDSSQIVQFLKERGLE